MDRNIIWDISNLPTRQWPHNGLPRTVRLQVHPAEWEILHYPPAEGTSEGQTALGPAEAVVDSTFCVSVEEVLARVVFAVCFRIYAGDAVRGRVVGGFGCKYVGSGDGGRIRGDFNSGDTGGGGGIEGGLFEFEIVEPAVVFFHALCVEDDTGFTGFSYLFQCYQQIG